MKCHFHFINDSTLSGGRTELERTNDECVLLLLAGARAARDCGVVSFELRVMA